MITDSPVRLPPGQEIAVISSELEEYRALAEQAYPQVQVIGLEATQDGIAAVTQALTTLQPIHRLHLVTPGTPGHLQLGRSTLSYASLPKHGRELCRWRSYLAPKAEILIYNNQVASNESGKFLIDVLHHMTGAAIAACTISPDATLCNIQWELDCTTLSFTPSLAFPLAVVAACYPNSERNAVSPVSSAWQDDIIPTRA